MKKLLFLLIVTILSINVVQAQNEWISYKIDNKLSVKLPASPTKLREGSVYAVDKDTSLYIVAVADFIKTGGLDSIALIPMAPTQDFANALKKGMLSQMPGFNLGDVSIGKWDGYTCYKLEGGSVAEKVNVYAFMVLIGSKLYGLTAMISNKKVNKGKDDFINSLVLN